MPLRKAIAKVIQGQDLTFAEAEEAMNVIMGGEATPAQIGAYLVALRMKGETVDEIAGSAQSMRHHVREVSLSPKGVEGREAGSEGSSGPTTDSLFPTPYLVDTCGTGGDGKHTFNISTTAAFVVAGCGVKVAKHGNRAASSRSGSADVLIALGGNLDLAPEQVAACIEEVGIGFLYAVNHHPAMRHAIGPRREIGQRTIFNILGPLTNPAGATHQLIGVYDPALTEPLAEVLGVLGSRAAFVVHGGDGLDELSSTGPNRVSQLRDGRVTTFELEPEALGLRRAPVEALVGGEPAENACITLDVLSGADQGPRRDVVLLNAAAALCTEAGPELPRDLVEGLAMAREAIDSGAALATLEAWIALTNAFAV